VFNCVTKNRYNIKANDAILAEEKHMPLYEELVQKYKVHYIAGGAAQNSIRGAQVPPAVPFSFPPLPPPLLSLSPSTLPDFHFPLLL